MVVKRFGDPTTWLAVAASVNSAGYAHRTNGSRVPGL